MNTPSRPRPAPVPVRRTAPQPQKKPVSLIPEIETITPPSSAYVALSDDLALEQVEHNDAAFFDSIARVKAVTMIGHKPRGLGRSRALAERRGYDKEDLFAVAEIGYHYLMNGGIQLAVTLFEGLTAVAPNEPYFAMALALSLDHQGDKDDAMRWYDKAAALDPFDARPDLNRAELMLEAREIGAARELLQRAAAKAKRKGDEALDRKATAMLAHLRAA